MTISKDHPGFAWLRANGIDRTDIAPVPVELDPLRGKIIYYTCSWGEDWEHELVIWGSEIIFCQRMAPLVVPPPDGLLEEIRRACRRAQLRELIQEIGAAL